MTESLERLYDELRAYKRSRALAVALSSGMLDALQPDGSSVESVARRCGLTEAWTGGLLELLDIFRLVRLSDAHWELTSLGEQVTADPALRGFAGYHLHCYAGWQILPERCRGDAGPGFHVEAAKVPGFTNAYLRSMDAIARQNIFFLQDRCRLTGTVLDVGAGPSTFCRQLAATGDCWVTALDLAPIVDAAKELFGYPAQFEWIAGDFRNFVPVNPFDSLFCGHLLEYASPAELPEWLARMRRFSRAGGNAAFLVFLRGGTARPQFDLTVFKLSTGVNGARLGNVCTFDELQDCLRDAGAICIECTPLPKGPSYSEYLVTCTWA